MLGKKRKALVEYMNKVQVMCRESGLLEESTGKGCW